MADTAFVSAAKGVWTEIAAGPLTDCLVTPNQPGFYIYAAAQPTADFGHGIGQFENVNAVPEDGESFWFLSPGNAASVAVTEREQA